MTVKWYAYFQTVDGVLVSEGSEDDRALHPLPAGIDRLNTYADEAAREAGFDNRERWDETTTAMVVVPETREEIEPDLGPLRTDIQKWNEAITEATAAGQSKMELTRSRNAATTAYRRRLQNYEDALN